MKHLLKTLTLAIVAIMIIAGLSSCEKNNGYSFEYTNVSFDTAHQDISEALFNNLKVELNALLGATTEAQLISLSDSAIVICNHRGINATITLKKGSSIIKKWTLEAKDLWHIEPADPE